jgi:exodeoxyribonuclease V gamma subunit
MVCRTMSLHLHRSERADALADGLAELLSHPLDDPFSHEVVAVPTRGVERWVAQSLATRLGAAHEHADGVCAGVDFPSPARLMSAALSGVLGVDWRDDPWRADRLTWPVLAEIEAVRGEPWAGALWSFIEGRPPDRRLRERSGRRWATASHLATLYGRYGVQRPGMIAAWLEGRDVDASGAELGPGLAWQAELWRRVRRRIDAPSAAERLPRACRDLEERPESSELPARLSVFGATRLDPDQLRVLDAVAVHRDVHLWLTHPSPAMWSRIADTLSKDTELGSRARTVGPRRGDPTSALPQHRLLAYLGRDIRELQLQLAGVPAPVEDEARPGLARGGSRTTLLAQLQDDLSQDRAALAPKGPTDVRPVLDRTDTSVQLHVSHGPDRQVEVLREILLGLLDDDPTLEPRDIVVLCPDIETFAPLIAATFGLDTGAAQQAGSAEEAGSTEHPGHRLRVRLADRSLRRVNPLLSVLDRLLELADSRLPASAVLDLASTPAVARRFGFSEDDLQRLSELVAAAGVRWGLDARQRGRFGLESFGQNTWAAGLDRMLLGVTMDSEGEYYIGTALPLDEVDSGDVDLVGRIAELVARVATVSQAVTGTDRRPLSWWMDTCRDALESLTSVAPADAWQSAHAYGELARLAEQADSAGREGEHGMGDSRGFGDSGDSRGFGDSGDSGGSAGSGGSGDSGGADGLALADVRALLADAFKGRATRANFRTGTLTMCTMLPMRSVPHRVICLLGVDDATFPRHRVSDGDDISALDPWIGDRDPRSEDRQLLLDAVMAAEEKLIMIYSGIDARTGASKPVAVPVGELLDALEETARTVDDRPVREAISTRHTLQPFDRGNFAAQHDLAGHDHAGQHPAEQDPAGQHPAEQDPAEQDPAGQDPAGQDPAGQDPVGQHPARHRPFSFDRAALRGAIAAAAERRAPVDPFAATDLPQLPPVEDVSLGELIRFFQHPAKALLRLRAQLYQAEDDEVVIEQIPIAPNGLDTWSIGNRLLQRHLDGISLSRLAGAEWRRGDLPPRELGAKTLRPIGNEVTSLAATARPFLLGEPTAHDVEIHLDGRALTGTVASVHENRIVTVLYSWLGAKHRLQAWIQLLALTAMAPEIGWQAVTIGRGGRSVLGPVGDTFARRVLDDLIILYDIGRNEPLPFAPKTSAQYARIRMEDKSVTALHGVLEREWRGDRKRSGERDADYARFFPESVTELLAARSRDADVRPPLGEPSRFGSIARRVWQPLLSCEESR